MFAFLTPVDQPYINGFAVCINPESSRVYKFLFLTAPSAAPVYFDAGGFGLIRHAI